LSPANRELAKFSNGRTSKVSLVCSVPLGFAVVNVFITQPDVRSKSHIQ
jgi:hypothetical protein